jgi:hypothetical protein
MKCLVLGVLSIWMIEPGKVRESSKDLEFRISNLDKPAAISHSGEQRLVKLYRKQFIR